MSSAKPHAAGPIRLDELRPGETATVVRLETALDGTRSQLADLGLFPGLDVRVIQRRPALLIEVDCTQVAVEARVASHVLVDRCRPLSKGG
ncbi:MAG: ferrous iron transport protein A [Acidobacteria bacterium]|jgi:Fe2+ transport system protein FeoA|nr:ferrous iron transport protein A [Acidobacteriota bacterium]